MTFTVTYRDQTGAKREEAIEAASRAGCVAECRRRGITPLAIREGANGRKGLKSVNGDKGSSGRQDPKGVKGLKGILSTLSLLALLGGAWWWQFSKDKPTDEETQEPPMVSMAKTVKEVAPSQSKVTKIPVSTNRVMDTPTAATATNNPYNGIWGGKKIVSYSIKTNGWSTYERIVTEDGKSHGVIGTTVKPIFDNGSDQMLALAVRASKDTEMPPMPFSPLMESDFMESLKKPIVINDGDSDEVKQLKRDVMQAREDMIDLVNKGMTVQQALEEHFKMSNENVGIRNKAVDELRAILDSGDEDGAAKYIETVNPILERMGAMRLELPEERIKGRKRRAVGKADEKH